MKSSVPPLIQLIIPLAGILLFVAMYIVAAEYYPGGSDVAKYHSGFDWYNNYWCDLIARYAKNGEQNPGSTLSRAAMVILFSSLSVFWFSLPGFFREAKYIRIVVGYTGMVAMSVLVFVFTGYHDLIIFVGGALSSIPFLATLRELYIHRWRKLYVFGLICLVLILLNFAIYISGWSISLLPFIQKITLVSFLLWIFLIDFRCILIRRHKKSLLKKVQPHHSGKSQLSI
ncbi:MAG: hypothetical protein V4604_06385 [Bacteroidota bacterium]